MLFRYCLSMEFPTASDDSKDMRVLRVLVVGAGVLAAALFVGVGLAFDLQTFGDGSIFSYAVATREVWAFHWHNIATRAATYALTLAPGELAVALTGAPSSGVLVYGLCLFAAPAVSLAATYALDRAKGRPITSSSPARRPRCSVHSSSAFRRKCGSRMRCSGRLSPAP